jgi:hypothetical protein
MESHNIPPQIQTKATAGWTSDEESVVCSLKIRAIKMAIEKISRHIE